ncbi:MAG TPA: hypothetical protein PLR52_04965 [Bacteroidales bacterium]|nr:hypothetical protein [Bacteroidales bacterium]
MYHVTGTVIIVSLLYLTSFGLYRLGIFSLNTHRKIWNTILASSFLFTALAGVLLALQINYKWDIPVINDLLRWHVETGVCMAATGIFHFSWHLSYYQTLFSDSGNNNLSIKKNIRKTNFPSITINLFIIGFTSTSIQLLLLREVLNISGGYELISGLYLGSWLITSAAGAALAGKSNLNDIAKINLAFSLTPLLSLLFLFLLSGILLEPGEIPSFFLSLIFNLLFLLPFCLISGFTFVRLIAVARDNNYYLPGKSFSIETTGGIMAGILISILTSGLVNTYKLLMIIILLTMVWVILNFYLVNTSKSVYIKLLFTILLSVTILTDPDVFFRQALLPGINVTETKDTPYGNITRGEYFGEESTYYNHRLLAYNDDVIEREEDIHYALLQVKKPEKVFLISGFAESRLAELIKYPIKEIHYIERDPVLAGNSKSLMVPENIKFIVENKDAYRFIREEGDTANVIIMLLPPPSTLSLNRFYTAGFFKDIKERLTEDGVFMCSPGTADTYLNQEAVNLYSSIYNTLSGKFKNVLAVAGNKLYLIASDNDLSLSFCHLLEERGINNIYVSPDYLADDLIKMRSDEIMSVLDPDIRENSSAFPIACYHYQSLGFSKNLKEKLPAIILIVIVFGLPVLTVRKSNLVMYFCASALSGFEIIILLLLQLAAGNMYQLTGLILAAMMTGLAIGAGMKNKILDFYSLKIKALILSFFYIFAALGYKTVLNLENDFISVVVLLIAMIIPSFITGNIFMNITRNHRPGSATGLTYSADLTGSAAGFILIAGILVPAFGIKISVFSLAMLIFAGILPGKSGAIE